MGWYAISFLVLRAHTSLSIFSGENITFFNGRNTHKNKKLETEKIEQVDEDLLMQIEASISETNDFFEKIELKDKALEIRKRLGLVEKPDDSPYLCEGCGS